MVSNINNNPSIILLNMSIYSIDVTLTSIINPGQRGPESNDTPHSPKLQY